MHDDKHISNPYSTGGGGVNFETRVQAAFVGLMLARGYAPGLPCLPIKKIKVQPTLQGENAECRTEDLIVVVSSGVGFEHKMIAQIKHKISITQNETFEEVIRAAWGNFTDKTIFTKRRDVIALITGPLSSKDIHSVRVLLEWARELENPIEFFRNLELVGSVDKAEKLEVFRSSLNKANGVHPVTNDELFEFLKHFHLLGYDLDIKSGVTLSLLHSMIGIYGKNDVEGVWCRLVNEVQYANQSGGTITLDSLPKDLRVMFEDRAPEVIPSQFVPPESLPAPADWGHHKYATDLAMATLIGAWNESNKNDLEIIKKTLPFDYRGWINHLREIL
jgi:hypothetical protein